MPDRTWAVWSALNFSIACAGTWLARRYALRRKLVDQPGERRSHVVPTPRGGGIAIVIAQAFACAWLAVHGPDLAPWFAGTGAGLLLVAGVGWIDDHRPLSPWLRLGTHAIAAALLAWATWQVAGSLPAAAWAFGLALVLTNVWNFMDGIDGLAASQALLAALGYAAWAAGGPIAALAIALVAACLGFLPFNLPRARIFLGDVGSGALGYVLAALASVLAARDGTHAAVLLLPLSAFLLDASLTLAGRIVRRERWWLPHRGHAYQLWAQRIGRHGGVTLAYAGWTLTTVAAMLITRKTGGAGSIAVPVAIAAVGCAAWAGLRRTVRGSEWGSRE